MDVTPAGFTLDERQSDRIVSRVRNICGISFLPPIQAVTDTTQFTRIYRGNVIRLDGNIRNDHIIIDEETGGYRWIDFDLCQNFKGFELWHLSNVFFAAPLPIRSNGHEACIDAPVGCGVLYGETGTSRI